MFRTTKPRRLGFERMEDRSLLAAVPIGSNPGIPAFPEPGDPIIAPIGSNPGTPAFPETVISFPLAMPTGKPTMIGISARADFVSSLYQGILQRTPDAAGVAFFNAQLDAGTSFTTVLNTIWNSAEHRSIQVNNLYRSLLGRKADAAGLTAWTNAMVGGMTEEQVKAAFLTSAEFSARNATNASFVTSLYVATQGRRMTTAQLQSAVASLNNGTQTRATLVTSMLNSHAAHLQTVNDYYRLYLNRSTDAVGANALASLLDSGQVNNDQLALAFLNSAEFRARHPITVSL